MLAINRDAYVNYDVVSGFVIVGKIFVDKLTVNDIRHLCERLNNFHNVRPDVWERGSELHRSFLNPAVQSIPKVTITQQAVRDSGLIQLDHPAYSRHITCSTFLNLKNFLGGVYYPNIE